MKADLRSTRNQSIASSPLVQWGLLISLVFIAFIPVLHCGFIWDDNFYVTENATLRSWRGLWQIWFKVGAVPQYYPLVHTTFWLEYHLWGLHPLGYHLDNVLLHALAATLLGCVLRRLQVPGAWLGAAIFALHPVQVESVAWITERKNVLSAVFYFAAALAYLRFDPPENAAISRTRRWRFYFAALALFAAALLSKTVTCSLPAALVLVRWWKSPRLRGGDLMPLLPFFAMGVALGLLTAWIEKHHVGAHGPEWSQTLVERCLIAGRALWFYAGNLAFPVRLIFIYPRWQINTGIWWQWIFPAAAAGMVASLWLLRNRIGRGPLVGVLFFAGTLGPALGFVNVYPMRYSFVADHFQYLACIGLIILTSAGLAAAAGLLGKGRRSLKPAFGGMLLLCLGVLTWRQCGMYTDYETLWRATVDRNPDCWMAHNNLGSALLKSGRPKESLDHFRRSLQLNPNDMVVHNDYGAALLCCGQLDEAEVEIRKALEMAPQQIDIHINLVHLFKKQGRLNEAAQEYKSILRLVSDSESYRLDLADMLCLLGRPQEAIPYYREVLEANPNNADVQIGLGMALVKTGDFAAGESVFSSVLKTNPRNARAADCLGHVLAMQGRLDEAKVRLLDSIRLDPRDARVHLHYAMCLTAKQQTREAMSEYRKALALDDQLSIACNNLAWVLATHPDPQIRNGKEAVELSERACRLTNNEIPSYFDTLAAAYAEAGQFDDAIATAQKAGALAAKTGQPNLLKRNQELLELYRSHQPYHETADP